MTIVRRTAALAAGLAAAVLVVAVQPAAAAGAPSPAPATGSSSAAADVTAAPVTGLTAVGGTSAIRLQWTLPADPGLAAVEVRRLEGSVPPATPEEGTLVAGGLVSTATDSGLDWATTYAYSVFSVSTTGLYSAPTTVVGIPADLPSLTSFTVTATSTSSISLSWVYPADARVAGVRLERIGCTSPFGVEDVVDVAAPTTKRVEGDLTRGQKYCYRARTYDAAQRANRGLPRGGNAIVWWASPVISASGVNGGDSVALSWAMPDDPLVTGVRVVRSDGVQVFDGAGTQAVDRSDVLPGRTYSYSVQAHTDEPRYAPSVTVRVNTSLHWTHEEVDPYVGWPTAMSCASATWCMATDQTGRFQVLSGSTWSAPAPLPSASGTAQVWKISCPTTGWCLGYGPDGFQRYAGGHWSAATATPQPVKAPWSTLTCTSSSWCLAMGEDGRYSVLSGNAWTSSRYSRGLRGASWVDVACQAAGRCFAAGTDQAGATWRATLVGTAWTTARVYSPWYDPNGIECPTSSWCVATSSNGYAVIKGTTWGAWKYYDAPGAGAYGNLSCASPTSCWASGSGSTGTHWNGRAWASTSPVTSRYNYTVSIQCPRGATACHAIDDRGRHYRWTASTGWDLQSTYDPTSGGLMSTACISDVSCFSIDQNGWLVRLDGTTWSRTTKLFYHLASIDCLPSGFCLAVDNEAQTYRTYTKGAWSAAKAAPSTGWSLATASCGSPTMCLIADGNGSAWRFTGTSWVAAGTPFKGVADGWPPTIRCTSATWCMGVSTDGAWSRYNGATWTAVRHLAADLSGFGTPLLSCAATTMCLAVVESGATAQWNGTTWSAVSAPPFGPGYRLMAIDCVTASHCIGVHGYSNDSAPAIWASGWVATAPYGAPAGPQDLDCPTLTTCFITTSTGFTRSRVV